MRETDGYSSRRQTKAAFKRKVMDEIKMWNMAGAGIPFDPG